jgi:putative methyltransferase
VRTRSDKKVLSEIIAKVSLEKETATLFRPLTTHMEAPTKNKGKGKASAEAKTNYGPRPTQLSLLLVLLHDLLFSNRGIALPKDHKLRKGLEKHVLQIKSEKERIKVRMRVQTDAELAEGGVEAAARAPKTRWMRINAIRWTAAEALQWLADAGWVQVDSLEDMTSGLESSGKRFCRDRHMDCLLAFPASLQLTGFAPYKDGRLIAQDKASCLPPFVLLEGLSEDERAEVVAIDAWVIALFCSRG